MSRDKRLAQSSQPHGGADGTRGPSSGGSQQPETPADAVVPQRLEQLQREVQQLKDQHLRMLAELDNTKKRLSREKDEFVKYASETMVRQLLPIIDSLDQAIVAVDKQADPEAIAKGVHLISRQLLGLLAKEGVARIPTVGEVFDPHRHEAVAQREAGDGTPDNTVVEEVQVGYTMHGKVIRPAIVKVAKAKDQKSEVRSGLGVEGSGQQPRTPNPEPRTDSNEGGFSNG